jgi:glycosyltransferase involved in cell wall biosynthesis
VSRIVPEKRQLDLIAAYAAARSPDWKLVLVGGLDETAYSRKVREAAAAAGVVLTGFQNGVALQQLYTHAGAFVLPSSHEGLPIALLEALSYGLPVLASDIPANLEIALDASCYFPLGDTAELARRLETISRSIPDDAERAMRRNFVARHYDWSSVAEQTLLAYRKAFDD